MAKLVSPRAELAVLRGMCHKNKKISGTLMSQIDETHFFSKESVELYFAIRRQMRELGSTPTYKLMLEDPEISEEARRHLRDSSSATAVTTIEEANKAARILNRYRQNRLVYEYAALVNDKMKGSKVDIEELMEEGSRMISSARSKKSSKNAFTHFGRNNNSRDMLEYILWGDKSQTLIPTGIEAFDEVNGGVARGSLMTIGANSGGGKSTVANAMGLKMAAMGYKVLMVPLEMSTEEMTNRIVANITKTNLTKIIRQALASGEKDLVFKRQRRWERKVKEAGGRYTIFKPEEDMTIEEIFASISAYDCDVVIVDYISLLKGTDGDDMWRALGAVARYAKINAEVENRVNILLCQVGDDAKIRYARAISEHSSNSWVWVATKESKETGITQVEQTKSRNSLAFPFLIKIEYEFMRVSRAPKDASLAPLDEDAEKQERGATSGKSKKKKSAPNLAAVE